MQDFFSVELQSPDEKPLPCIEHDQQRWFVGEPGQEFIVAVRRSANTRKVFRASLRVDGQRTGVSKYLKTSDPVVFQGWLHEDRGSNAPKIYTRFKFASCNTSQGAVTVDSADDIAAGRIEVKLVEVVSTGRYKQQDHFSGAKGPNKSVDSKKLPEGKKWFMAPGLKADAGSKHVCSSGWTTTEYREVATLPSIHLRYDSSEALYLRKALNPRFAPHRAILRKSANPAIAALGAELQLDAAAAGAAAAAAGDDLPRSSRVKSETAGVKRERDDAGDDDEYVPRSATAQDRVDLTEEPVRPMTVNGRQLAPDELAVCDLCDSDEEGPAAAPRWQVKKKQQIEVTEM